MTNTESAKRREWWIYNPPVVWMPCIVQSWSPNPKSPHANPDDEIVHVREVLPGDADEREIEALRSRVAELEAKR